MIFLCDVLKDSCIRTNFVRKAKNLNVELLTAKRKSKTTGRLLNTYYLTKAQFDKIKTAYTKTQNKDIDFEFVLSCVESKLNDS